MLLVLLLCNICFRAIEPTYYAKNISNLLFHQQCFLVRQPRLSVPMTFLMMMKMMNCFCGMFDLRKAFRLISSRNHCQRSSPSRISDAPWAGCSGLIEWSCAVVITTTPRCHIRRRVLHLFDKNISLLWKRKNYLPKASWDRKLQHFIFQILSVSGFPGHQNLHLRSWM